MDRNKATVPTSLVKQIVGTDDAELQRWVASGKIQAAEPEPGRGKSRVFTPNQVIGLALLKQLTNLGIPVGTAILAVSSIDLSIQGAEFSAALGTVNARVRDRVRYAVIARVSSDWRDWNDDTKGDCVIVADSFEEATEHLSTRKSAIFLNIEAIETAVLSRLSPL